MRITGANLGDRKVKFVIYMFRYEVASLAEERDSLRKDLESQKYQTDKTISKLQYRLKSSHFYIQKKLLHDLFAYSLQSL